MRNKLPAKVNTIYFPFYTSYRIKWHSSIGEIAANYLFLTKTDIEIDSEYIISSEIIFDCIDFNTLNYTGLASYPWGVQSQVFFYIVKRKKNCLIFLELNSCIEPHVCALYGEDSGSLTNCVKGKNNIHIHIYKKTINNDYTKYEFFTDVPVVFIKQTCEHQCNQQISLSFPNGLTDMENQMLQNGKYGLFGPQNVTDEDMKTLFSELESISTHPLSSQVSVLKKNVMYNK